MADSSRAHKEEKRRDISEVLGSNINTRRQLEQLDEPGAETGVAPPASPAPAEPDESTEPAESTQSQRRRR